MTPEQLVEQLREALGPSLKTVVLYGSAAAGDFVEGQSDYNILVVADPLDLAELGKLTKASKAWARAGYRPPLLFRPGQLAASVDAFPIELFDLARSHRILHGGDPLENVEVPLGPLRLQLEREFKGKLLNLRERAVLAAGKPRKLADLMTATVNSVLVLIRASVRLYQDEVPATKLEALEVLANRLDFDASPMRTAFALKNREARRKDLDIPSLFSAYLGTIERLGEAIDRHHGTSA